MFDNIVVPLDGSRAAEIVLPYLEEIASKFGSQIRLVSVCESGALNIEDLYHSYLEGIRKEVGLRLCNCAPRKEVRVKCDFLPGEPAKEILNYVRDNKGDLILIASRGSSSQSHWILGNIAAKVLRAALEPVLLVRTPIANIGFSDKGFLRKILVPLDGSERGAAAIPYVKALAMATQVEIVLLHVIAPSGQYAIYGYGDSYAPSDPDELKKASQKYLEGVAGPLKDNGVKASIEIGFGSPADEIIDYAATTKSDLIAISTHGRTGIGRWVFGSVTDKVLNAGDTAVLVIRSK